MEELCLQKMLMLRMPWKPPDKTISNVLDCRSRHIDEIGAQAAIKMNIFPFIAGEKNSEKHSDNKLDCRKMRVETFLHYAPKKKNNKLMRLRS